MDQSQHAKILAKETNTTVEAVDKVTTHLAETYASPQPRSRP